MERKELPKIDFTEYVGQNTEIETGEVIETKHGLALKITSKELDEKGVKASSLFSFQKDDEGNLFIGVDTKLDKFLVKKGLDASMLPDSIEKGMVIPVLTGTPVKVQMNVNSGYLELF